MIIPSIDLINGHAGTEMGDPRALAEQFGVVGEIAVVDLDAAMEKGENKDVIIDLIKSGVQCRVGGGIRSVEAALFWLNLGATKVILGTAATPEILSKLPKDRVIAALDVVGDGLTTRSGRSVKEHIAELKPYVSGFWVTFVEHDGKLHSVDLETIKEVIIIIEHMYTPAIATAN